MNVPHDPKAAFRARFQAYRTSLTEAEHRSTSEAICARLAAMPEFVRAACIHAFWPLERRREIDLRPLLRSAHRTGKRVLLPVVLPGETPRMRAALFEGEDHLRVGPWGVHEPMALESVPLEDIDLVIVPGLGADRAGYRLGYGRGFYDAFLAGVHAPSICPIFEACLVDRLPIDPHDIPVSYLATESRLISAGASAPPGDATSAPTPP